MYIIVGLGNPGRKYQGMRHNIGFDVIDYIANQHNIKVNKLKHQALIGEGQIKGERVLLAKPQTYMNLSGEAVKSILNYYKVPLTHLVIIYDDIDISLGALRIRHKGSSGTHNGMRNIIFHLKEQSFPRFRIGVGKSEKIPLKNFVLTRYNKDEVPLMEAAVKRCSDAIEMMIEKDLDKAMNTYNG